MNKSTVAPTEVNPFQYKPFSLSIRRSSAPDGTFEYQHPAIEEKIKTYSENLLDVLSYHIEHMQTLVYMLDDTDLDRFGFLFEALIRDAQSTIHEADHFIRQNIGVIKLTTIAHGQLPFRGRTILDAKIQSEVK